MSANFSEKSELDGGSRGYSCTEASDSKAMRPTVSGSRHAISAGHYLAAAAGFAILYEAETEFFRAGADPPQNGDAIAI